MLSEPRMVFTCGRCEGTGFSHCDRDLGPCLICQGTGRLWETDDDYAERLERIRAREEENLC